MGGIKNSIDLELKVLIPHHMFSFPWHFFMVNDSNIGDSYYSSKHA
jgi:hypothetical protein